jgi:hypothetical protein
MFNIDGIKNKNFDFIDRAACALSRFLALALSRFRAFALSRTA